MATKSKESWNREDRDLLVELRTLCRTMQEDIKKLTDGNAAALQKHQTEIDLLSTRVTDLEGTRIALRATFKAWIWIGSIGNAILTILIAGLAVFLQHS